MCGVPGRGQVTRGTVRLSARGRSNALGCPERLLDAPDEPACEARDDDAPDQVDESATEEEPGVALDLLLPHERLGCEDQSKARFLSEQNERHGEDVFTFSDEHAGVEPWPIGVWRGPSTPPARQDEIGYQLSAESQGDRVGGDDHDRLGPNRAQNGLEDHRRGRNRGECGQRVFVHPLLPVCGSVATATCWSHARIASSATVRSENRARDSASDTACCVIRSLRATAAWVPTRR